MNLTLKYYPQRDVSAAFIASPDFGNPRAQALALQKGTDAGGNYITVTISKLEYWDMVYFR